MARDWWWPWWISSAIDIAVAFLALGVAVRLRRPRLRTAAALVACAALAAAALAPIVMEEPADHRPPMQTPMKEMSR